MWLQLGVLKILLAAIATLAVGFAQFEPLGPRGILRPWNWPMVITAPTVAQNAPPPAGSPAIAVTGALPATIVHVRSERLTPELTALLRQRTCGRQVLWLCIETWKNETLGAWRLLCCFRLPIWCWSIMRNESRTSRSACGGQSWPPHTSARFKNFRRGSPCAFCC